MGSVVKYSAVITKLRAMYSRLLKYDDYVALSNMTSVGEVVHYLKEAPGYAALLADVNEATVHRGTLEHLFSGDIIKDAEKLASMLGEKEKRVLKLFLSKYEIDIVKRAVRSASKGGGDKVAAADAAELEAHKIISEGLDVEKCFSASNLRELEVALSGTEYAEIISRFPVYEARTAIDIGTALDELYFSRLQKGAKQYLSGGDSRAVNEFLSAEVSVFNILWIYRYKKYYDMSVDEIINHLIPNKQGLGKAKVLELASADLKDYTELVQNLRYRDIFKDADERDWDKRFAAYLYKMYHRQLRNDSYSFSTVLAYLYLKEMDINNIITVVEGVRYGVEPEKIRKYIDIDIRR